MDRGVREIRPDTMRAGTRTAALVFGFATLVVLVFADPLFLRRNFGGRDLVGYHLPIEKTVHDAYARGRLPVWISEVSGGRPLAGNPNVGAFYPLRWLFSAISFPMAMRIFPILHWSIAGAGMMLLLRHLGAAWLGALTYVFSGVGISDVVYTNLQPGIALLPWVVWAIAQIRWPVRRRVVVLSFLLGLDLLAGDIFTTSMALLLALLWIFGGRRERPVRTELAILAVAGGLALLLALPQLVAAVLWAPYTQRAMSGFRLGESVELSLSPARLLELLIPFPFGDTWRLEPGATWARSILSGRTSGFFTTLYAGAFAPIALITLWLAETRGARFARAILICGLLLAVPGSLLPAFLKSWRSPLPLRHPEKFAVLIAFALALCAGLAWEQWRLSGRSSRWILVTAVVLAALAVWSHLNPVAAAGVAVRAMRSDPAALGIASDRLGPALAEGAILWMTTLVALEFVRGRTPGGAVIGVVLLSIVPIVANRRIALTFREDEIFAPTAFARLTQRVDPEGGYRTLAIPASADPDAVWAGQDIGRLEYWRRSWLYFTPALWGRGTVFNQDADLGDLARTENLRRLATQAAAFTDSAPFFGSLALRFAIRFKGEPVRSGYRRVGGDSLQDWDEHREPYPDIRLLSFWREAPSALEALRELPGLRSGQVVLESGVARSGAALEGAVRVFERTPEQLRLETDSRAPSWLFVVRGYFPYRRVLIDGLPAEAVPAQIAFSAVAVPAGHHRIEWTEQLPGGNVTFLGPVLFLLLSVPMLALRTRSGDLR
jgi:hypothetical protein